MFFDPIIWFITQLLNLFLIVMVIRAVMSWLFTFDVLNRRNHVAWQFYDMVTRITEPALRPIRRFIPSIGGLDISFIILFLLIYVIQMYLGMAAAYLP